MYNFWLVQIRIHEAVKLLQTLITDEYRGEFPSPEDWEVTLDELIETIYKDDMVVCAGLLRYQIVAIVDYCGLIVRLDLIER